ncbi:hypothetical protein PhaeoP24_01215 [Phaeobacter inhibens]|uniref:hypothetical protein n=1 Tax=Phaeobacter inhibens TaxID=221822 RepID=UPI000C99C135|nr:hypothetical protein [Phaeobacter inhibens]AUQ89843.1 hypothetical protein PhaeoP24_01215 [Phaeobacter inhibens]
MNSACNVHQIGKTIEKLRTDYAAASAPAGPLPPNHSRKPCRGLDTGNPGCVADAFEALNSEADQERFHEDMTAAFIWGVWFLAFLCAAGAYLAAGPILRLIAWMAGAAI